MTGFDSQEAKRWLLGRGVRLRPPADPEQIAEFQRAMLGPMHPDILQMYEAFDGCEDRDFEADSFITIWSIDEVLQFSKEQGFRDRIAFADWSLACDVAVCRFLEPGAPVSWDGCKPPNPTFADFWACFMGGHLRD